VRSAVTQPSGAHAAMRVSSWACEMRWATLILNVAARRNGPEEGLRRASAEHRRKPYLVVHLENPIPPREVAAAEGGRGVDRAEQCRVHNIAGPRPGYVYKAAVDFLQSAFQAGVKSQIVELHGEDGDTAGGDCPRHCVRDRATSRSRCERDRYPAQCAGLNRRT
jgi:hypothetical protein